MIRTIGYACFKRMHNNLKSLLKSNRLTNYFIYLNKFSETDGDLHKTWQVINELTSHKSGRSSVKELSLNGVSMINSNALSNTFKDHFSTITA